jgi:hypothetical protein
MLPRPVVVSRRPSDFPGGSSVDVRPHQATLSGDAARCIPITAQRVMYGYDNELHDKQIRNRPATRPTRMMRGLDTRARNVVSWL